MTLIENDNPKVHYTGPFIKGQLLPLTFPYIAKTDVHMLIDGVPAELNKEFEIITEVSAEHPVAYPNSAYIKNALPNAKQITLYRVTPLDQQAPFPQMSKFRSERIEQALDKLTMQQQEQEEQLSRCIIAPITLETFNGQLPAPAADQVLKWNTEGTELENYDIIGEQEAFKTEVNTKFEEQSIAIENRIVQFEEETNTRIGQFEEETNTQFSEFRNEINENLEAVLNAADKLETLEQQVQTANDAANTATTKADEVEQTLANAQTSIDNALSEATEAVNNATEQANIATQKADEIIALNPAKTDLSNLTEQGIKVIKDNSGSGLEVCDIGMALYIDETKGLRRYLNGQIVDINANTQAFLNRLKDIQTTNPDYFTDEDTWQAEATLNLDGCVYKFVLNYAGDTVVSVRLPKYPDYVEIDSNSINSTAPVSVYGNGIALGCAVGSTKFGLNAQYNNVNIGVAGTIAAYGKASGASLGTANDSALTNKALGITTDPAKSGLVGTATITSKTNKTQTALLHPDSNRKRNRKQYYK